MIYDAFISHCKLKSRKFAIYLKDSLSTYPFNLRCFLDVDNLVEISELQLQNQIEQSGTILIIIDDVVSSSTWCQKEWEWANTRGISMLPVCDVDEFNEGQRREIISELQKKGFHYIFKYQMLHFSERTRQNDVEQIANRINQLIHGGEQYLSRPTNLPSTPSELNILVEAFGLKMPSWSRNESFQSIGDDAMPEDALNTEYVLQTSHSFLSDLPAEPEPPEQAKYSENIENYPVQRTDNSKIELPQTPGTLTKVISPRTPKRVCSQGQSVTLRTNFDRGSLGKHTISPCVKNRRHSFAAGKISMDCGRGNQIGFKREDIDYVASPKGNSRRHSISGAYGTQVKLGVAIQRVSYETQRELSAAMEYAVQQARTLDQLAAAAQILSVGNRERRSSFGGHISEDKRERRGSFGAHNELCAVMEQTDQQIQAEEILAAVADILGVHEINKHNLLKRIMGLNQCEELLTNKSDELTATKQELQSLRTKVENLEAENKSLQLRAQEQHRSHNPKVSGTKINLIRLATRVVEIGNGFKLGSRKNHNINKVPTTSSRSSTIHPDPS